MKIKITPVSIEGDRLYEATCDEFPYLVEYADTYEEAESLIWDAVDVTIAYLEERHRNE
jgi:predicted RNase H-like HicB family nuclease